MIVPEYGSFLGEGRSVRDLRMGDRVRLRDPDSDDERRAVYVLLDDPKVHSPTDGLDCRWDNPPPSLRAFKPVFRYKQSDLEPVDESFFAEGDIKAALLNAGFLDVKQMRGGVYLFKNPSGSTFDLEVRHGRLVHLDGESRRSRTLLDAVVSCSEFMRFCADDVKRVLGAALSW